MKKVLLTTLIIALSVFCFSTTNVQANCMCIVPFLSTNPSLATKCVMSNTTSLSANVAVEVLSYKGNVDGAIPSALQSIEIASANSPGGILQAKATEQYTFVGHDIKKGGKVGQSQAETAMALLPENARYAVAVTFSYSDDSSTSNNIFFSSTSGSTSCLSGSNKEGFIVSCYRPDSATRTKVTVDTICN